MSTRPVPAATTFAALDHRGRPVAVRVSGVRQLVARIRTAIVARTPRPNGEPTSREGRR